MHRSSECQLQRRLAAQCSLALCLTHFGTLTDPYGHHWSIATHIEDLTPEELGERAKEAMATAGGRP